MYNINTLFRSAGIVLAVAIAFCLFVFFPAVSFAQQQKFDNSFGVAQYIPLPDEDAADGTIIAFTEKEYVQSRFPYDPDVIGVVTQNPAVVFKVEGIGKNPLLQDGNVYVRVSGENGPIKKGDQIASSSVPGVGMKADRSGFVLGAALEEFNGNDTKDLGKIYVALNLHYLIREPKIAQGFFELLSLTALTTYEAPTQVFRYFLAGIIVIMSSVLATLTFARVARNGIEALGRNPLAGRTIQVGIFMNVMITLAIVFSGLAIAYLVLTL